MNGPLEEDFVTFSNFPGFGLIKERPCHPVTRPFLCTFGKVRPAKCLLSAKWSKSIECCLL